MFQELTDTIVITGRLPPENVYQYLMQIRNCPSSSRVCTEVILALNTCGDHCITDKGCFLEQRGRGSHLR